MVRLLSLIFLLFSFVSCLEQSKENSDPNVSVKTDGIYDPITFLLDGKKVEGTVNLGEYVTASEAIILTVSVKNNTKFPMTGMNFSYPDQTNKVFNFASSSDEATYPGEGGTCGQTLASGAMCEIKLSFYTSKSGAYEQLGTFSYQNLVEDDAKNINFKVLAGQPASLIFDDGSTSRFIFGNRVGLAKKPVLERADVLNYHRELTLSNMGELSARTISFEKLFSCSSLLTNNCPVGYEDPWTLTHNCPSVLKPLESCKVSMDFLPPNQDPVSGFDPVLEEIYYKGEIKISYKATPTESNTSLNGLFETNSTTIRARFETSKGDIDYGLEVVSGNFKQDIFNIKNVGYREGELKSLIFEKNETIPNLAASKAICIKTAEDSDYLKCYDETLTNELSLHDFPFVVKDRNNCFRPQEEEKYLVAIDENCIFDIRFQPSTAYLDRYDFEYDLSVKYDARWKGNETIYTDKLFKVIGKSVQPAKIEISKIIFDGGEQAFAGAISGLGIANHVDLGRLALLSPGNEEWRKVTLTFHNRGGVPIDIFKAFVGFEAGTIPVTEIPKSTNSAGITIGPHSTKYFKDMVIDMNNCGNGSYIYPDPENTGVPTSYCLVSFNFAPIGMDTNLEEDQTMFDLLATDPKLRVFSFDYHNGTNFSDANIKTEVPDINSAIVSSWKGIKVGLTAKLVKKGYLKSYSTMNGDAGFVYRGREVFKNFIFTNIGTGPISYIPYLGSGIDHESNLVFENGIQRVDVPDPSIYGANYDCNDVIDFDFKLSDDVATIQNRLISNNVQKLAKLQTCVLRLKFNVTNKYLAYNPTYLRHALGNVPRDMDYDNSILNYLLENNPNPNWNFIINFYDGDVDGQIGSPSQMKQAFGEYFETGAVGSHLKTELRINAYLRDQARFVIANPTPYQSAIIYAPETNYPSYVYKDNGGNSVNRISKIVPAAFYAYTNILFNSAACTDFTSCLSPYHASSQVSSVPADIDYVIHAGTFPVGETANITFQTLNVGNFSTKIKTQNITGDSSFTLETALPTSNFGRGYFSPTTGVATGGYVVSVNFNAVTEGTYFTDYLITYLNGREEGDIESSLKVRIFAEAKLETPLLKISSQDYEVTPVPGDVPDEELLTSVTNWDLALNHSSTPVKMVMEAVQVKQRSTESSYTKKLITVKNDSTTTTMSGLQILFKDSPLSPSASTKVSWSEASNFSIKVVGGTCAGITSLSPSSECTIELWYQPLEIDSGENISLSVLFDTDVNRNQYIQKNLTIEFLPKKPSVIRVNATSEVNIAYRKRGQGPTVYSAKAFVIDLESLVYSSVDKTFEFSKTLSNTSLETRASLLKQYEEFNGLGNTNYGPGNVAFVGGFVKIYHTGPMEVYANSVCLFGSSDVSGLPNEEKGFNNNSSTNCSIKIVYSPSYNVVGRKFVFTDVNDVSEMYIPLKYYNNKRSSTDEFLITFVGRVYPDKSILSLSEQYYDVSALDNGEIRLSWSPMLPVTEDLGEVVGYRVYYSKYTGEFGDEIFMRTESNAEYIDIKNGTTSALIYADAAPTAYYLYVAAIRYNSSYTAGNFAGLLPGEYLSHSPIQKLKVIIPPTDLYYYHAGNMLISYSRLYPGHPRCNKAECNRSRFDYYEAIDACEALDPVYISDKGLSQAKYFDLISQEAWDSIETDFMMTSNYSDAQTVRHWIKSGLIYNIDDIFGAHPLYDSSKSYQKFDDIKQVYFRPTASQCTVYGTCNVAKTEGGLFNNMDNAGFEGFMGPAYAEGVTRCYIPLD